MKKILVMACLLALVAILAVPMVTSAAPTPVTGTVKYATVTVVAPKAITWTTFAQGWNFVSDNTPTTKGSVTVTAGTSGTISATVTAKSAVEKPWLYKDATNHLDEYLLITLADTPAVTADWHIANGGDGMVQSTSYTGPATKTLVTPGTFAPLTAKTMQYCFRADQYITANDAASHAGTYTVSVEFTAVCLP